RERWVLGSIVVVAVALVLVLLAQIGVFDGLLPGSRTAAAPASGAGEPDEPATLAIDPGHPFVDSPAASWPDGAAGIVPPVAGPMSVKGGNPGELVVHTNYVFVYAFQPDNPAKVADLMDILVVVRADVDYILRTGNRWTAGSQGWWYGAAGGYAYSIACDAY